MLLDRKPLVYLWAPLYRLIFVGIVWPFIARIKTFFFQETAAELETVQRRLDLLQAAQERAGALLAEVQEQQRQITEQQRQQRRIVEQQPQQLATAIDSSIRAQWMSMEALLLCMLRNPGRNDSEGEISSGRFPAADAPAVPSESSPSGPV